MTDVSDRARALVAELLGYRDWDDATDYRTTGEQDRQRDKAIALVSRFERDILAGQSAKPVAEGATDNGAPPLSDAERAEAIGRYATPAPDSPAIPEGMKPWHGGESAPDDWDGGAWANRNGSIYDGASLTNPNWTHAGSRFDVYAYTPTPAPDSPAMAGAFEREERYIIIKRSKLSALQLAMLRDWQVPTVSAVVVEADWPEYETVWRMIEGRVTGQPTPASHTAPDALRERHLRRLNYLRDMLGSGELQRRLVDRDGEWTVGEMLSALAAPAPSDRLREALRVALDHYERSICHHDETHRGGILWTICDQCGAKWADDEGGFTPFEYPPEIIEAQRVLSAALATPAPSGRSEIERATKAIQSVWQNYSLPIGQHLFEQMALAALSKDTTNG